MSLINDIKKSEDDGFKSGGIVYVDTLGFDTLGYGTKLPLSEKECSMLLVMRLEVFTKNLKARLFYLDIKIEAWNILIEMAYQMGIDGLLKFKNMIHALKNKNYKRAAIEGRDSRWNKQTPNRSNMLMSKLERLA